MEKKKNNIIDTEIIIKTGLPDTQLITINQAKKCPKKRKIAEIANSINCIIYFYVKYLSYFLSLSD